MGEIDLLNEAYARIDEKNMKEEEEYTKEQEKSLRERLSANPELLQKFCMYQADAMRSNYYIKNEDFDTIFNEYLDMVLDGKIKNMIDFCQMKQIVRKEKR